MVFNAPLSSVHLSQLPPNLRLAPAAADGSTTGVNAATLRAPGSGLRDPGNKQQSRLYFRLFSSRLGLAGGVEMPEQRAGTRWGGRGLCETPWAVSACSRLAKHSARTWARAHRPPPSLLRLTRAAVFRKSPHSACPRLPPRVEVHICLGVPLTSLGPFFPSPSLFLLL